MGGCAGKKKSKEPTLDATKKTKPKTKDDNSQSNSTPSSTGNLPLSNDLTVNNGNRLSKIEENGIDPGVKVIIDEQNGISKVLGQKPPMRVISVSDSVLENELANLVYGNPENDYAENPHFYPTFKSTEV